MQVIGSGAVRVSVTFVLVALGRVFKFRVSGVTDSELQASSLGKVCVCPGRTRPTAVWLNNHGVMVLRQGRARQRLVPGE